MAKGKKLTGPWKKPPPTVHIGPRKPEIRRGGPGASRAREVREAAARREDGQTISYVTRLLAGYAREVLGGVAIGLVILAAIYWFDSYF